VRISLDKNKGKFSSIFKKKCLNLNESDHRIRKKLLKKEYEMSDKNSFFSNDNINTSYENHNNREMREPERSNKNEPGKIYSNFPTNISDSDLANNIKIQNIQNYNNSRLFNEKATSPDIENSYSHNQFNGDIPTVKHFNKNFNPNKIPIIRMNYTEFSSNSDIESLLVTSETDKFYKNKRHNYDQNNFYKINNIPYFRPNLNSNSPENKYLNSYSKETLHKYQINSNQANYISKNKDLQEEHPKEVYLNKKYSNHKQMFFPCEIVGKDSLNINNNRDNYRYLYKSDSVREATRYDSSKYANDFLRNNFDSNFNKIKDDRTFPQLKIYPLFSFHPTTEANLPSHFMSNFENEELNNMEKNNFKQPSLNTNPKIKHSEFSYVKRDMGSSSLRIPMIKHKNSASNLDIFFE